MKNSTHNMAEISTTCASEAAHKLMGHMAEYVRRCKLLTSRKPEVFTLDPKQWRTQKTQARTLNR